MLIPTQSVRLFLAVANQLNFSSTRETNPMQSRHINSHDHCDRQTLRMLEIFQQRLQAAPIFLGAGGWNIHQTRPPPPK